MALCKNCEKNEAIKYSEYSSGNFCRIECARAYSTKEKRKEIGFKISKKLTGTGHPDIIKKCPTCYKEFSLTWKRKHRIYCSAKCAQNNKNVRLKQAKRFEKLEERIKMRDIGLKGGWSFGKTGYTNKGNYHQSTFEKQSFELLEEHLISFVPHKFLPNSSKISDIFLSDFNLWVELDGMNREKIKNKLHKNYQYWLEKLDIYKEEGLDYKIFKNFEEFKSFILNLI